MGFLEAKVWKVDGKISEDANNFDCGDIWGQAHEKQRVETGRLALPSQHILLQWY